MKYIRSDGLSILKYAKLKKVCYHTIYAGIQRGLSVDEACEQAKQRKNRKDSHTKYFVGKRSLRYYCANNGLNYRTICRKIRSGMSVEKALRS